MRVWWRGPADNRVDVVTAGGETGVHRDAGGTWTWEYERADRHPDARPAPLALPAAARPAAERARPPAAVGGDRRRSCPGSARAGSPAATPSGCGSRPSTPASSVGDGRRLGRRAHRAAAAGAGRRPRRSASPRSTPASSTSTSPAPPRRSPPSPRRPASPVREGRESEVLLEAGARLAPGAAARRRWPACRGAGSTACPPGDRRSTAAASPCSPSPRCRGRLADGLRHALAPEPDGQVDRRARHPGGGRPDRAHARRRRRAAPLRAHRHRHPRRADQAAATELPDRGADA